jgi:hypothetical protein
MIKKLLLTTSVLFFGIAIASDERHDKFDEWCQELKLESHQLKQLSLYLENVERILEIEKIKNYKKKLEESSPENYQNALLDEESGKLIELSQALLSDPVVFISVAQAAGLALVDASYAIPNEVWKDLPKKDKLSDEDIDVYLPRLQKAISKCRLCTENKLKKILQESENK